MGGGETPFSPQSFLFIFYFFVIKIYKNPGKKSVQQAIFDRKNSHSHNSRGGSGGRGRWGKPIFPTWFFLFFKFFLQFFQSIFFLNYRIWNDSKYGDETWWAHTPSIFLVFSDSWLENASALLSLTILWGTLSPAGNYYPRHKYVSHFIVLSLGDTTPTQRAYHRRPLHDSEHAECEEVSVYSVSTPLTVVLYTMEEDTRVLLPFAWEFSSVGRSAENECRIISKTTRTISFKLPEIVAYINAAL